MSYVGMTVAYRHPYARSKMRASRHMHDPCHILARLEPIPFGIDGTLWDRSERERTLYAPVAPDRIGHEGTWGDPLRLFRTLGTPGGVVFREIL